LIGANLDIKKISKILEEGLEDYENELIGIKNKTGLEVKNLDQYLTGEIVLAVDQLKLRNIEAEFPDEFRDLPLAKMYRDVTDPVFNVSIGIKNKDKVKQVLDRAGFNTIGDGKYFLVEGMYLILMNDFLYFTNDVENVNQIAKDAVLAKEVGFTSEIKKSPVFGYMNLNLSSIKNIENFGTFKMMNPKENSQFKKVFSNFKHIEFKVDNKLKGDVELLFAPVKDSNDNTLQRLVKMYLIINE
jgi:hypothetical protein